MLRVKVPYKKFENIFISLKRINRLLHLCIPTADLRNVKQTDCRRIVLVLCNFLLQCQKAKERILNFIYDGRK